MSETSNLNSVNQSSKSNKKTPATKHNTRTRMWANAQRDGHPAEHRWGLLFNAAKFGWGPLLHAVQSRCQDAETVESSWGAPN